MTENEWMNLVREHKDKLDSLIVNYHPVIRRDIKRAIYKITAHNAELACANVRESIKRQSPPNRDVIEEFNQAVTKNDIGTINIILNEAWFGVPESTSCWNIKGFREAVSLLEDLPE